MARQSHPKAEFRDHASPLLPGQPRRHPMLRAGGYGAALSPPIGADPYDDQPGAGDTGDAGRWRGADGGRDIGAVGPALRSGRAGGGPAAGGGASGGTGRAWTGPHRVNHDLTLTIGPARSEEHTSELQSLMRIPY